MTDGRKRLVRRKEAELILCILSLLSPLPWLNFPIGAIREIRG
jgi:hypothetical protein